MKPGVFTEKDAELLLSNQFLATDPDIAFYCAILSDKERNTYPPNVTAEDIQVERASLETVKDNYHYLLIADRYEVTGIISLEKNYLRVSRIMTGIDVLTKRLRIGDPVELTVVPKRKKK